MNKDVIKKRIKVIRRELNKKKIKCLIVTKPANVTYTTGFLGDDNWAAITKGNVYLLTDSRYIEQAQSECPNCTIMERSNSMSELVAKLVKKLESVRTVTVEKSTSLGDFETLKKHVKSRFRSVASVIETVRSSKDNSEIKTIEAAASIATQALKQHCAT